MRLTKKLKHCLLTDLCHQAVLHISKYGYVPQTLNEGEYTVDCLIATPFRVAMGTVVQRKPICSLETQDKDGKFLKYWDSRKISASNL